MKITDTIRACVMEQAGEHRVRRAQIGLIYCAVQLESGATGVAFTFPAERSGQAGSARPCGAGLSGQGNLAGRTADQLIEHLGSEDLVSSALGMAASNAVIAASLPDPRALRGDILDNLDIRKGDRICMVGCFLPVLDRLANLAVEVHTVDRVAKPGAEPAERVEQLLPESQVAIITGTSIINGTIDELLRLSAGCREVAILGPSTPLLAEAFRGHRVHCLSGVRVDDPDEVFRVIGEGGGFRFFKNYTTKLNIRLD
jgi:uncharacterized protein (DUF4213/DUF364 family)